MSVGQRKKYESLTLIEPITSQTPGGQIALMPGVRRSRHGFYLHWGLVSLAHAHDKSCWLFHLLSHFSLELKILNRLQLHVNIRKVAVEMCYLYLFISFFFSTGSYGAWCLCISSFCYQLFRIVLCIFCKSMICIVCNNTLVIKNCKLLICNKYYHLLINKYWLFFIIIERYFADFRCSSHCASWA